MPEVKECDTKAAFDEQVKGAGSKLVVVDFHATWCGPCKMVAPKIKEMAQTDEDVVYLKVDVDENEETAAAYNIEAMPTFIFLKDGKEVGKVVGADINKIKDMVAAKK